MKRIGGPQKGSHTRTLSVVTLAVVLTASVCLGPIAFVGTVGANADTVRIVGDSLVAGDGTVTVTTNLDPGETAHFQIADADGVVSATQSVTDGGPGDRSGAAGTVETTLDLATLFDSTPATGGGVVYIGTGATRDPATGSFEAKRSLTIDSTPPSVALQRGATASQGDQVKLGYTATDRPQSPVSVTLDVVDRNGTVYRTFGGLTAGEDRKTQLVLSNFETGTYDLRLTAVDGAGATTTETLNDGLVVTNGSGGENSVQDIDIVGETPANGRDELIVDASVSTAGETASFVVEDVNANRSATKTVTDGGPLDRNRQRGAITATLALDTLFTTTPASGPGIVYAGGGFGFDVAKQGYETKTQLDIDTDAPAVTVVGGDTVAQGSTAVITYSVTSVLQNVRSIELSFVGSDGTVYKTTADLQTGTNNGAQIQLPVDRPVGTYDIRITAVDSVGFVGTDTLADGLTVTDFDGTVKNFELRSNDPIAGNGTVSVSNDMTVPGENATYKLVDASGTVSTAKTVRDGGPGDRNPTAGKIRTTLNLSALYASGPATGTALVYAGAGEGFSVSQQTFDAKKQFTLDATAPTATVVGGASGQAGDPVKIGYTATDDPQGLASINLTLVGPNGTTRTVPGDLGPGTNKAAQFEIPVEWAPGTYDVRLTVVDTAGYRSNDTLTDGFVIEN
jgi:hypothetical protein